jgi:hypothetical protein
MFKEKIKKNMLELSFSKEGSKSINDNLLKVFPKLKTEIDDYKNLQKDF